MKEIVLKGKIRKRGVNAREEKAMVVNIIASIGFAKNLSKKCSFFSRKIVLTMNKKKQDYGKEV